MLDSRACVSGVEERRLHGGGIFHHHDGPVKVDAKGESVDAEH